MADEEDAGIFAFERFTEDGQRALAIFNTSLNQTSSTSLEGTVLPTGFTAGTELADLWRDVGGVHVVDPDGTLQIELPPSSAMILVEESIASGLEL